MSISYHLVETAQSTLRTRRYFLGGRPKWSWKQARWSLNGRLWRLRVRDTAQDTFRVYWNSMLLR